MAELEALLRELLVELGQEINSSVRQIRDLVPTLRPLATESSFASLIDSRDHEKRWSRKFELTQLDVSTNPPMMPGRNRHGPQPPLDGRTIQLRHLELVWRTLGLADPIPSASAVGSLKKLTLLRNEIAHRNESIVEVFRAAGRTADDIATYIDDVILVILHIGDQWSDYAARSAYRA